MFFRNLTLMTVILGAGVTLSALPVSAEEAVEAGELVTDRPDQTESPVVVAPGHVQIETGATYTEDEGAHAMDYFSTLVRIGLNKRLELRLGTAGWNRGFDEDESPHFGDAEIGGKVRLWDEDGLRPEAALLFGASVPIGSDEVSSNGLDPAFRFSLAHTLSERLSFGYNFGVAWETTQGEPTPWFELSTTAPQFQFVEIEADKHTLAKFEYTATLGIGVTERLGTFVEVFGEAPLNSNGETAHSFDGGFTYLIRPNVQFDISGGVGLNDAAEDWFIGMGLSFRLPK